MAMLTLVRPSPTKTEAPQEAAKQKDECHWILRRPPGVIIENAKSVGNRQGNACPLRTVSDTG